MTFVTVTFITVRLYFYLINVSLKIVFVKDIWPLIFFPIKHTFILKDSPPKRESYFLLRFSATTRKKMIKLSNNMNLTFKKMNAWIIQRNCCFNTFITSFYLSRYIALCKSKQRFHFLYNLFLKTSYIVNKMKPSFLIWTRIINKSNIPPQIHTSLQAFHSDPCQLSINANNYYDKKRWFLLKLLRIIVLLFMTYAYSEL